MRFWIVNVFVRPDAKGRVSARAGNPLAVVECPQGRLTAAEMQAIAFEFGFSETTFVTPEAVEGAWPTRIFTPTDELPFAGHPTLGTAHVVRSHLGSGAGDVRLALGVGEVPVRGDHEGHLWLTAPPLKIAERPDAATVARDWAFDPAILDPRFPPVTFDAGPAPTLVPLRSVADLEAFRPPVEGPGSLYLLARDETAGILRVRLFAPGHGVPEDPATGSAACCLGRYLLDSSYLGDTPLEGVQVHQGAEMGRPSLLLLNAGHGGEGDRIEVGGAIAHFAHGALD